MEYRLPLALFWNMTCKTVIAARVGGDGLRENCVYDCEKTIGLRQA